MARTNDRGLFEQEKGFDVWWINYYDHLHRRHREIAGTKAQARALYDKRKREARLAGFNRVCRLAKIPDFRWHDLRRLVCSCRGSGGKGPAVPRSSHY
jgi:hypothetical protein